MKMAMNVKPVVSLPQGEAPADTDAAQRPERPAPHGWRAPQARPAATHGVFVPLLLCGLAVLGTLGYQTALLIEARSTLQATHASQQQTVDNAARLRQSLDALAADTQRLADAGNPNAGLLVNELAKRGITINAHAGTPAETPAATAASAAAGR